MPKRAHKNGRGNMEAIRLVHLRHFDPKRRRFTSVAFKNSSKGGGVSIIERECALRTSASVCHHIATFYREIAGYPAIFWLFDTEILPSSTQLDNVPSDSGDDCHYNIRGVSDDTLRDIFVAVPISAFSVCLN